jgi:UDP-N-acetyl-D-mannosaminuronic acid dehydrogenase
VTGFKRFALGQQEADLAIVGGAGHVGLPLALVFASKGLKVLVYDIAEKTLDTISQGIMPFSEHGAETLLEQTLASGRLFLSSDPADLKNVPAVIITIGTPVDEFLNPVLKVIWNCMDDLLPYLNDGQLLILRSTLYPGTTEMLARDLAAKGRNFLFSFCPERIVQGYAVQELQTLPQIVSGVTPEAEEISAKLFEVIAPSVVRLTPLEAEFAKLFANAYRYIQFAISNQLYMISSSAGVDYYRVLEGMKQDYPRLHDIPKAGFAAGPCLFKDTMQLAAFFNHQFSLGHAAMLVNEGLVSHVVDLMSRKYQPLENYTVGLLGMAFKANVDDTRSSLSYKLKKMLKHRAKAVLLTDPHVTTDPELIPLEEVIANSDVLVLCTPHNEYRNLDTKGKPVVDIWGFLGNGGLI